MDLIDKMLNQSFCKECVIVQGPHCKPIHDDSILLQLLYREINFRPNIGALDNFQVF